MQYIVSFIMVLCLAAAAFAADTVSANLNGLGLEIEKGTGSIISLSVPGQGKLIDARSEAASILDMAYPVPEFEPLRLASRFSKDADIKVSDSEVAIHWERMGASRDYLQPEGSVKATVTITALPDKKSTLWKCRIENASQTAVRQVLFPDFGDIIRFAGSDTLLKTCGFSMEPFSQLTPTEGRLGQQFCMDASYLSEEYTPGGLFDSMVMRWFDLGSHKGGLSFYPEQWGWDKRTRLRMTRDGIEEKIRLSNVDLRDINPGEAWESPDYILTAHEGGWAKGIETYAEYAHSKINRPYPVPKRVQEAIGFRSVKMCLGWEADKSDPRWRFSDFPALCKEAAEHGLSELNIWSWHRGFRLPLPEPYSHLGTMDEFVEMRRLCKEKYGVEVTPFISVLIQAREGLERYGVPEPQGNGNNWTQHTETIPRFQPTYSSLYKGEQIGPANKAWKKDALDSMAALAERGLPSISWDQYFNISEGDNNMVDISREFRKIQKAIDPDSTWSGEEVYNMEISMEWLDYTWNWGGFRDRQAFNSIFKFPRVNMNVTQSGSEAKKMFMDNFYINAFPRIGTDINGNCYLKDIPNLSEALKTCWSIKQKYMPFFTEGRLIGDCISTEFVSGAAKVSAYILENKALVLVMNTAGGPGARTLNVDAAPWLGDRQRYTVKPVSEKLKSGKQIYSNKSKMTLTTPELGPGEIYIYEITGH